MLQSFLIDNYALIEHLDIHLNKGFTVITGETGAGKSIIMGALSLILGQRADAKSVRNGATKCVIEAAFDVSQYNLQSFFNDNDLEYDVHNTIIRREVYATGKSRAFINDIPVQLTMLKILGEKLIDIHSQHQNLLLGKDTFQQEVIDTLAANNYELGQYKTLYKELSKQRKRLKQLREEAERNANEADFMRFQFEQLDEANLKSGEQEELEAEQDLLSHAEDIKEHLVEIQNLLDGPEQSIVSALKSAMHTAQSLKSIYPDIEDIAQRLETDCIDLKDIADDVTDKADAVNFDAERNEEVEERLGIIYSLFKKHGVKDVESLIALRDELDDKLQHIDNSGEEISELESVIEHLSSQVRASATALTASRKKAAHDFELALIEKVAYLGMPNIRFEVSITPTADFTPTGADEINFLFTANKNQTLKPVGEIASGGEISRLMLSIKALISSAKALPTIVFDEIDTGVSGDIADRMGQVMKQLSKNLQVLTITHLPQVAAKGDAHYKVYKADDDKNGTVTHIDQLTDEARLQEVARMLSGSKLTEQAIENARVLMICDE